MKKLISNLPLSVLIICTFAMSVLANPNKNGAENQKDAQTSDKQIQCNIKLGFEYAVDNLTVEFTNTSIGNWENINWDFGDGKTANLSKSAKAGIMSHTYNAGGSYTFCLTATNTKTSCNEQFCGKLFIFD